VPDPQAIEDLVARLERERLDADRLYNDALTAVDRALHHAAPLPEGPAGYDASQLPGLNGSWDLLASGDPSFDGMLRGRIGRAMWEMLRPIFERQRQFNAALVDHLNRNQRGHEDVARAVTALIEAMRRELEARARFESLLVQYLQTITVYVDSKDRSLGGTELRERLALTEQRLLALKRTVEQGAPVTASSGAQPAAAPFAGTVDSITYVGFEDRFRGTQEDIRGRVEDYLPLFAGATDVVDIGCGRGELLALLAERGVPARGVDANAAMVELCRSRGLAAEQGDALSYLERQADGQFGGLIAIQVVEHMAPAYLLRFLETAFHKMRPGAPLVLETINPACWMAFFETYVRDPTHQQPVHPDTLKYLVQASGFTGPDVQFRSPVPDADRLSAIDVQPEGGEPGTVAMLERLTRTLNDHAAKLNRRLFSFMDYAVVARR